jgi:hypothetical protein
MDGFELHLFWVSYALKQNVIPLRTVLLNFQITWPPVRQ